MRTDANHIQSHPLSQEIARQGALLDDLARVNEEIDDLQGKPRPKPPSDLPTSGGIAVLVLIFTLLIVAAHR